MSKESCGGYEKMRVLSRSDDFVFTIQIHFIYFNSNENVCHWLSILLTKFRKFKLLYYICEKPAHVTTLNLIETYYCVYT